MSAEARRKVGLSKIGNKNNLGRPMTPYTKEAIKRANTGRKKTKEWLEQTSQRMMGNKIGVGNHNRLGKTLTEEHKQKLTFKGHKHKEESLQQLSKSLKVAWSKREGWHHTKESKEKNRIAHLGQIPWTKGKSMLPHVKEALLKANIGRKLSEEQRKQISLLHTGNKYSFGKHRTEEEKQHLRELNKGKTYGRIYQPHTEDTKKKMSKSQIKFYSTEEGKNHIKKMCKLITKISKPQRELYEYLKQIFPDAVLEHPIETKRSWRSADIAVPSLKLDFEYDGEHWHNEEKDRVRDKELSEVGWATFRINNNSLKILSRQPIFSVLRLKE